MSGKSPGNTTVTGSSHTTLEESEDGVVHVVQVQVPSSRPPTSQTTVGRDCDSNLRLCSKNNTKENRGRAKPVLRRTERSDDERRLLGDYEQDVDAVPISVPRNPPSHDKMTPGGVFQGGPRPTNTLNNFGGSLTRFTNAAISRFQGLKRGYQGNLDLVASSGNNVQSSKKAFDLHADRVDGPVRKKARITSDVLELKDMSHSFTKDAEGEIDPIMLDQRTVERLPPLSRKTSHTSLQSQGSGLVSNSQTIRGRSDEVPEYRAVEDTMKIRSKNKQRSRNLQKDRTTHHSAPSVTIDLSTDDNSVVNSEQRYRGTARETKPRDSTIFRKQERVAGALSSRDAGARSNCFASRHRPKLSSKLRDANGKPNDSRSRQQDLHAAFVDGDGNRRNSFISDSSDELQGETTFGRYVKGSRITAVDPLLEMRRVPRGSGDQPTTPPRQVLGLPESNIRRTEFTNSGRRSGNIRNHEEGSKRRTLPEPWAVGLKSFRTGNIDLDGKTGCGLIYDKVKEAFVVHHEANDLSSEIPELSLQLQKLQRVTMGSPKDCRLELLMSRSANADCRIGIELCESENVVELIRKLQSMVPGCKIHKISSDKMNQIFERRLSRENTVRQAKERADDIPDEVDWLTAKEKRRKLNASANRRTGSTQPSHGPESFDDVPEVIGDRPSRGAVANAPSQSPDQDLTRLQRTIITGKHREGGINTHQKINNSHETRSQARLSANGERNPTVSSPAPAVPPTESRYFKLHDLGTPWAKPLVYPPTGKRKATVEWKDLSRLDEGEFLNDNLIGFYLLYLENRLEKDHPELAKKVYFFNTYFFASLTNTPRGKKGINYEAVKNWTRTVDIFSYDYVVVPINESAHWYVTIICNLPALDRNLKPGDEDATVRPAKKTAPTSGDGEKRPVPPVTEDWSSADDADGVKRAVSDSDADSTRNSFAGMNLDEKAEDCGLRNKQPDLVGVEPNNRRCDKRLEQGEKQEHPQLLPNPSITGPDISLTRVNQKEAEAADPKVHPFQANSPSSKKGRRKPGPPPHKYEPDKPIIITLDSLGLSHSPTIRILKDYLAQEGKAKRALEYPDDAIRGMTAKEIPLQDNFCDCGLYLLGYMDKLVKDPQDLCRKILQRELDLQKDWPSLNPSQMRHEMRINIQELHAEQEEDKKESAKRAGIYVSRKIPKPAVNTATATDPPQPLLSRAPDEQLVRSKPTRQSALESAIPIDQEDRERVKPAKKFPRIKPSLEELRSKQQVAKTPVPKIASQDDSLVL